MPDSSRFRQISSDHSSAYREAIFRFEYFARSGPAFAEGRQTGNGILHAALAIRHDWARNDPGYLHQLVVIRLSEPLYAYHGEAAEAPDRVPSQCSKGGANHQRKGRPEISPADILAGTLGVSRRVY
jgi:hypothetical protein